MVNLAVLTPFQIVRAQIDVQHVLLPANIGYLEMKTGHVNMVVGLEVGLVKIKANDKWTAILVYGGIGAMTRRINQVTVLSENLEDFTNIDELNEADIRKELEATISEFQNPTVTAGKKDKRNRLLRKLQEQTARLNAVYLLKNNKGFIN